MKKALTYLVEKKQTREEHKLVNEAMGYFGDDFETTINLDLKFLPVEGTIEKIRETARLFKITKSADPTFRWAPELEEQLSSFGYI